MRKFQRGMFGFFLFMLFLPMTRIQAAEKNKMSSIEIEVEVHEDASATIREKREMASYEDTEVYIRLINLGPSELLDFQVNGFEEEEPWNIDASFEEKANKYGVIPLDKGYELAWGISEYGPQEYELSYQLSNLVRELEDGQALFWNFDSFLSLPTDRMKLTIQASDFSLSEQLVEFYAFGAEGTTEINEAGAFEWTAYGLDEGNDVIALLQFPSDTFQAQSTVNQSLAEQKEMALAGSSYNEEPPMPTAVKILLGLAGFSVLGVGGFGLAYVKKRRKVQKENKHFVPYRFKNQLKDEKRREAPQLEGPYENYSWLISKLSTVGGGFSEYFFLYLLEWANAGYIDIHVKEEKGFFADQKKAEIEIINFLEEEEMNILNFEEYVELFELGESRFEELIWGMLLELADASGRVRGEEIEDWSEEHAESIFEMVELLEERSFAWLEDQGYIKTFTVPVWSSDLRIEQLTDKGEKLAFELVAYQNFLEKIEEVDLKADEEWEKIMQWAILFGIAEETIDELKDLDPVRWAELETTYPYYYGNYYGYHYLYTRSNGGLASGGYSGTGAATSSMGGGMGAGGGGGGGTR